jgi:hypothetical protein
MMTHIMKTLYKFFKTAEVSQQIIIHQKVKVEKYNLKKDYFLMQAQNFLLIKLGKSAKSLSKRSSIKLHSSGLKLDKTKLETSFLN